MGKPSNRKKPDRKFQRPDKRSAGQQKKRNGIKKVFSLTEQADSAGRQSAGTGGVVTLDHVTLDLPGGPVIQVHSPRMRGVVDTFLKNTSSVQTGFRSILQGPGGGFQGDMNAIVIAHIEGDICTAAIAATNSHRWFIHSTRPGSLQSVLDLVPPNIIPRRIGGEAAIIKEAIDHTRFKNLEMDNLLECTHLVLGNFDFPVGPGGHHRLARTNDVPRLDEYAIEFEKEVGYPAPTDWRNLIAENRIMLNVVEGTVASVAIRKAETLDHILIEGVYTFKPFRRRGLAKKLVAALARQGVGKSQSAVTVVGRDNRPMLSLLDYLQFTPTADYNIVTFFSP